MTTNSAPEATPPARPVKGSPEWDLWVAAIEVAAWPPLTHSSTTVYAAKVPWSMIEALRERLDALGVDWKRVHR